MWLGPRKSSTTGAKASPPRPAAPATGIPAGEPAVRQWTIPKVIPNKKKTCDFCVKRKRSCDGQGRKRCSFCIAKNQPECHYSRRQPMPSRAVTAKKPAQSANRGDYIAHDSPPPQLADQSSWHTDGSDAEQGERRYTATDPQLLPLKRGQFSASPATGLIGLQENGFLSDFFECLGFLSLTSESAVRTAIFSVMRAAVPGEFGQTAPPPTHLAQGAMHYLLDGGSDLPEGYWDQAVPAGHGTLLHDSSTCLLWCAVALGALVRGCPLENVEGYVDLAQVSLTHCLDGFTVDTARWEKKRRAYLTMAILHDFLGNPTKSHGYLESANSIVHALPPEGLPTGIYDVLRYAGKSWVFERASASKEEIDNYVENAVPIWKLPGSFVEQDVCSLILSVDVRVDRALFEERSAVNAGLAEEKHWSSESIVAVSDSLFVQEILGGMHKEIMPEMLRLEGYFGSSRMTLGLGGLLFYGKLAYLQAFHNDRAASASLYRSLGAMLRYPGLCRHNCVLHLAHVQLWCMATCHHWKQYEELRDAYNHMRPAGHPAAPPLEEWLGMSDICEHVYCRRVSRHMAPLLVN